MDVKHSLIEGLGLFALVHLKKGTHLTEYFGTKVAARHLLGDVRVQTHIMECEGTYVVGNRSPGFHQGMGQFANHSSKPNCGKALVDGRIVLIANKDLEAGEECTLNYGDEGSDAYKMAMGTARLVVKSTVQDSGHVEYEFTTVPLLVDGQTLRVKAPSAHEALQVASRCPHAHHHRYDCMHGCVCALRPPPPSHTRRWWPPTTTWIWLTPPATTKVASSVPLPLVSQP